MYDTNEGRIVFIWWVIVIDLIQCWTEHIQEHQHLGSAQLWNNVSHFPSLYMCVRPSIQAGSPNHIDDSIALASKT